MKTFLIIAWFIGLTVAFYDSEFLAYSHKECSEEAKITSNDLIKSDVKDAKYQKYSECMLTKLQMLKDGAIDMTSAKQFEKRTKDCSFYDECAKKEGDSKEETYAIIYKCLMSNWFKINNGGSKN